MYEFYRLGRDISENLRMRVALISTTLGQGSPTEYSRERAW